MASLNSCHASASPRRTSAIAREASTLRWFRPLTRLPKVAEPITGNRKRRMSSSVTPVCPLAPDSAPSCSCWFCCDESFTLPASRYTKAALRGLRVGPGADGPAFSAGEFDLSPVFPFFERNACVTLSGTHHPIVPASNKFRFTFANDTIYGLANICQNRCAREYTLIKRGSSWRKRLPVYTGQS